MILPQYVPTLGWEHRQKYGLNWYRQKPWWQQHYATTYMTADSYVPSHSSKKELKNPKIMSGAPPTPRRGRSLSRRAPKVRIVTGPRSASGARSMSLGSRPRSTASMSLSRSGSRSVRGRPVEYQQVRLRNGRMGGYKKMKKAKKNKKLVTFSSGGCNKTIEASKLLAADNCAWIGHSTFACGQYYRQIVAAMFTKICIHLQIIRPGYQITDTMACPVGTTFQVFYQASPNTANTDETYTFDAGEGIDDFVNWFTSTSRKWNYDSSTTAGTAPQANRAEVIFDSMIVTINGVPRTFSLAQLLVSVAVKSSLKMQNRTKAKTDGASEDPDDSGNIDRVPLVGKYYTGNGNTLKSKLNPINDIISDHVVGAMLGSDAANHRREPPHKKDFISVKSCGGAKIEPGAIKTSYLTHNSTRYFNNWFRLIQYLINVPVAGTTIVGPWSRKDYGAYRCFALEKLLNISGITTEKITLGVEVNYEISTSAKFKPKKVGLIKETLVNINF